MVRIALGLTLLFVLAAGCGDLRAATARPCAPSPDARTEPSGAGLTSADLGTIERAVRRALETAQAAACGADRRSQGETPGETQAAADAAEVSYGTYRFRFGAAACVAELTRMAAEQVDPGAGDRLQHAEARLLHPVDPARIRAAFDAWVHDGPREDRAVADLAIEVAAFGAAHPHLRIFVVKGGGSNARSAGVAFVDLATREAVWIFAQARRWTPPGGAG